MTINTWTRLEPRARSRDLTSSLEARVRDPLWYLARQWQVGEFDGEDAGSPIVAHVRGRAQTVGAYRPGLAAEGAPVEAYDVTAAPLEEIVEAEPVRRGDTALEIDDRRAAELGQRFLRLLKVGRVGAASRRAIVEAYSFAPASEGERHADEAGRAFRALLVGRAVDGRRLYADLAADRTGSDPRLFELPGVGAPDRSRVETVATMWLGWVSSILPAGGDRSAWVPERMEYAFALGVGGRRGVALEAAEHLGGRLDWYSFDLAPSRRLASHSGAEERVNATRVPTPVSFRGMPATRWWECEDREVDLGDLETAAEDLSRLVLMEFALIYANDWFVIPLELPVGSLYTMARLRVVNTFGEVTDIPAGRDADWRLFELSRDRAGATASGNLFLPPVTVSKIRGPLLEEVDLARDQIANMGWGVEKKVSDGMGRLVDRRSLHRIDEGGVESNGSGSAGGAGPVGTPIARYRPVAPPPAYWIPLVPTPVAGGGFRLALRPLVDPETGLPRSPQGEILHPPDLEIREEEVLRGGVILERRAQYCRWTDGSVRLWTGRRKRPGAGDLSSALAFDRLETDQG